MEPPDQGKAELRGEVGGGGWKPGLGVLMRPLEGQSECSHFKVLIL